jgi:hypothetical protein
MSFFIMRLFGILAFVFLAACSAEPDIVRIDGSDFGRYEETVRAVRESLNAPEQLQFEASLKLTQADVFAKAKDRTEYRRMLRERLNGKSAQDVIQEAQGLTKGLTDKAVDAVFDAKRVVTEEAEKLKQAAP